MPRWPLLSSIIALCTARVVTPAPPTAGRNVKICASVVSCWLADFATRAQVRTSSTGGTGLTMKSATRICKSVRATLASKACVITTTGGHDPMRVIRRSSACISSGWLVSRSTTTTVAPAGSKLPSSSESVPETSRNVICSLAPKVWRACDAKSGSAVSTTTSVLFIGLFARPIFMSCAHSLVCPATRADHFTAAAGAACGTACSGGHVVPAACNACCCTTPVVLGLTGMITRGLCR